jgi:DNA-binding CsgD family transcriptional regulator
LRGSPLRTGSRPRFRTVLVESLERATHLLGGEVGYFMLRSREGVRDVHRVLLACDPAWALEYSARECFRFDPWLRYASSRSTPVGAERVRCNSVEEAEVVNLAAEYGFSNVALIPAPAPLGKSRIGLLVIGRAKTASRPILDSPDRRAVARDLAMALHEDWVAETYIAPSAAVELSQTERRLLELELRHLSTKVIARELRMSCASVNSKFQRINRRFGVTGRHLAALRALDLGLLETRAVDATSAVHDVDAVPAAEPVSRSSPTAVYGLDTLDRTCSRI